MSQRNVERTIGRLVTDEAFRHRFLQDPKTMIQDLVDSGVELTPYERWALASINAELLARFAEALDPCIQKSDLHGDAS